MGYQGMERRQTVVKDRRWEETRKAMTNIEAGEFVGVKVNV